MLDNFSVNVYLVIFARDPLNKQNLKLVLNLFGDYLSFPFTSHKITCLDTAQSLLLEYTGLEAGNWIKLDQSGIIDYEDDLSIIYSVILPEIVELKRGDWYELEDVLHSKMYASGHYILNHLPEIIRV